ncbi:Uncharacterised protein g8224 [Pycnogonum litorale]
MVSLTVAGLLREHEYKDLNNLAMYAECKQNILLRRKEIYVMQNDLQLQPVLKCAAVYLRVSPRSGPNSFDRVLSVFDDSERNIFFFVYMQTIVFHN